MRVRTLFPMPLTDDQRAMLQLVLQHGQSYEDISALQGIDVEGVRSSARAALAEIGGEDPDTQVGLTDYLLGQADPIGRADVARQLQSDSDTRALAERLEAQLRLIAPGADLPSLVGDGSAPARRKAKPAAQAKPATSTASAAEQAEVSGTEKTGPSMGERLSGALGEKRTQAIAGIAGVAVLVVVIILLVAGGGDDSSSDSAGNGGGGDAQGASGNSQQASNQGPPRAVLEAQDGSDARGIAVIGQIRRVPTLQVTAFNLAQTADTESYAIWLRSSNTAIPLGRTKVTKTGRMQVRLQLPTQILQFIGDRTLSEVDVSLVQDAEFRKTVSSARSRKKLPQFTGEEVLSGPIVGAGLSPAGGSGSSGSG
jgi:hypothetical protein